ncbi:MAG: methyl-accepting chemotaxis protein, partial [Candidatus Thorarchaeota archaeon]
GIGIILSFGLIIFLSKTLINPLNSAVETSKKISEGNLANLKIKPSKRSDEIGVLINSSSDMVKFLLPILMAVESLTTKLVTATQEIASSSEEVNSSSEELSAIAQQSAKLAQEQELQVKNSTLQVKTLNEIFQQKIKGILQTSEIINSIQQDINLLSLNASIEAVRAGEYGRGFAVVAQNIKKLSDDTKNSLVAIETNIEDLVGTLNNAIELLMDNFSSLSSSASEYSSQSEETGASTEQQVASLEEITATAQELTVLSNELKQLSARFSL